MSQITRDQTLAQVLIDSGVPAEKTLGVQHILTNSLGGKSNVAVPTVGHVHLHDGDRLLLCSNGLTDHVSPDEMAEILERFLGSASGVRRAGAAGSGPRRERQCDRRRGRLPRGVRGAGRGQSVVVVRLSQIGGNGCHWRGLWPASVFLRRSSGIGTGGLSASVFARSTSIEHWRTSRQCHPPFWSRRTSRVGPAPRTRASRVASAGPPRVRVPLSEKWWAGGRNGLVPPYEIPSLSGAGCGPLGCK